MTTPANSIFELSPAEKLQLVQDLWDDLASQPDDVPLHDWQLAEVARRKANLQQQAAPSDWQDMVDRIRSRYAR